MCADEPVNKCTCQIADAWIQHDTRTICCECNQPPPSKRCFPAEAKIKLQNGRLMSMSELQIGERVQTGMTSVTMCELRIGDKVQNRYDISNNV